MGGYERELGVDQTANDKMVIVDLLEMPLKKKSKMAYRRELVDIKNKEGEWLVELAKNCLK